MSSSWIRHLHRFNQFNRPTLSASLRGPPSPDVHFRESATASEPRHPPASSGSSSTGDGTGKGGMAPQPSTGCAKDLRHGQKAFEGPWLLEPALERSLEPVEVI
jgi:hypothetical protein